MCSPTKPPVAAAKTIALRPLILLLLSAGLFRVGVSTSLPAATGATLAEVRKIWDAAPHSAFTDLIRHNGAWLCVFREGSGHIPGSNGVIRVLRSADGKAWTSVSRVREEGIDLRDPKISVMPDGRLMLLTGGSVYDGEERPGERRFVRARTHVAFSRDGSDWSAPRPVSVEGEWLWRVTWHRGVGYGFGYTFYVPAKDVALTLWRTTNGVDYERIVAPKLPSACWPDETTLRFRADDTLVALVRGEQADHRAFVGTSRPPYTEWTWADTGHAAQGPNFLVLPDGRMYYAGRDYPAGAKTVFGELTVGGATPLLTLPSGGDTSYPGMVWHEGLIWMSYYASHEGKASIYLAKIDVGGAPAVQSKPKVAGPTPRLVLPGTENFAVEGRPAFVFLPAREKRSSPQPWIFYAPTLPAYPDGAERWMHEQFLEAGVAVAGVDVGEAYGSPKSHAVFDAFYRELTGKRGFAARPCLFGRSRGGLWVSSWAIAHPERVSGLIGIYPVFDFRTYPGIKNAAPAYGLTPAELEAKAAELNPVTRLDVLAKARVPAVLIHGDVDTVVPLRENSAEFVRHYREAGVESLVNLIVLKGQGHNFYEGFFHSQELVDFAIARARAGR